MSDQAATSGTAPGWARGASIGSLIIGLGLGLLTLGSVAGIWLGLWDFRRAFGLLGMANKYALYIAWLCVALSVTLIVMGQLRSMPRAGRLVSLSLLGAAIAWAAYLVPESYRPPEGVNYPPIHDISTDRVTPPAFVAVLPLRSDAPNPTVYGTSEGMTPEKLAQMTEEAYPDLVTRRYSAPIGATFADAVAAVDALGWELVAADENVGRIEATATTFWFRFKDDVVIRIVGSEQESIVDARSTSRVGRGDVGANANRLRAFFDMLDG